MPEKSGQKKISEEILCLQKELNQAWLMNEPKKLRQYFHQNTAIINSDLKILGTGIDSCIKSYEDFVSQSTIHEFNESDHQITLFGGAALLIYHFFVDYEIDGKRYREDGKEMLVFSNNTGDWKILVRVVFSEGKK